MKPYLQKIEKFLLTHSVWMYLTLFLFFSHLLHVSMVKETWGNYIYYFFAISGLYFPVLFYAFFRKEIKEKLPNWLNNLLWMYCFLFHGAILHMLRFAYIEELFPLDNYMHGTEDTNAFKHSFHPTIAPSVLATELGILFSHSFRQWFQSKKWSKRLGLDELLFASVILLSCLFGLASNLEMIEKLPRASNQTVFTSIFRLFYFGLQSFIVFMGFYGFYYFNKNYLIPQFLSKKGIVYYGFSLVLTVLIAYPIFSQLISVLPLEWFSEKFQTVRPFKFFDRGIIPGLIMIFSVPIVVALQWFEQNSQIANLEKEKSATELNLLKQQINPHFFFNTLNNLYALSIVKDQQTPEVILQLSELMRYVIYKGKEESVMLKEEVKYIEDYVQLQQIRLHKQLDFRFDKQIENEELEIPPLLFINFVENAFKHGIEPAEHDCFLHLTLTSSNNQLVFTCKNSFEEKNVAAPGIGIKNLQRRMDLRFPNQHKLRYQESDKVYEASLELKLG